jgi:hypothetical protein
MNVRDTNFNMTGGGARALCAALLLAAAGAGPAWAAITQSINYQGFLISKVTNLPVETPPDLKFLIYSAPTGGAPVFTESRCNVPITKGRYDVEIGSATSGGVPSSIFSDYGGLWLEIQVDENGDCSGVYEAMTPRIRLQAAPYAFSSLYASTASAGANVFSANIIGALPQTTYGAVTISTNLFVQGGISVGSISPGQKLAVAGVVESTGNWPSCATPGAYTCGFKFTDGSVQVKAAALTMWDILGINLYTINEGNTNVGGGLTNPQARLHISSAAGDTGDLLLVSTGTGLTQSRLFLVNGHGEVYGNSFYGDGSTLSHIVRSAGDTMTGQLTLSASSLTVTSAAGLGSPKVKFREGVEVSSAPAAFYGGVYISSNIYAAGRFYGDGAGLTDVVSLDSTKVRKSGDTMTGQLTLAGSTLTITGAEFSVAGSTLSVLGGNTAVGSAAYLARLTVGGGVIATSSITSQTSMHAASFNSPGSAYLYNVTAASGTFWGIGPAQYSIETSSTIKVNGGVVDAPYFIGSGSLLTGVLKSTDTSKVSKLGDTMTGSLKVLGSSLTVVSYGAHTYALTVGSVPALNAFALAVTTAGNVGVHVLAPSAPLEVNSHIAISNLGGRAHLDLKASDGAENYLRWTEESLAGEGNRNQGALGYPVASRDLVYSAGASVPGFDGQEVFRVKSDMGGVNWRFGIGTPSPTQRFQVGANTLVSTPEGLPLLFVSTTSGRVSVNTLTQTHALTVDGGISAVSSVTAQGGFYGSGAGLTGVPASALPRYISVSTITAAAGSTYDGIVFSTTVYFNYKLGVGQILNQATFTPSDELHVRGVTRLDHKGSEHVVLLFNASDVPGDSYIRWDDPLPAEALKGVLGIKANSKDLVYRGGASNLDDGVEVFRAKPNGRFIVGSAGVSFNPADYFHVLSNMSVAAPGQTPILHVSTVSQSVGLSTGTPKERVHVGSSFLVGGDRASAALYVSTQSGYTGIGTGNPQATLQVAGYALVNSSLTVTGTGVAGTEDVLNVKSGALVVRNDDRVGIGVAPDERLHVNGKVKATGFAASRGAPTNTCAGFNTCQASCVTGSVMGGGCSNATGTDYLTGSFPFDADTWQCDYSGASGSITAYAICSTVE